MASKMTIAGDDGMQPGIFLGLDYKPPTAEGVFEGVITGDEKFLDVCHVAALFFANLDMSQPEVIQDFSLCFPHEGFFLRMSMVMSQQVQHPVHDQQLGFCLQRMAGWPWLADRHAALRG